MEVALDNHSDVESLYHGIDEEQVGLINEALQAEIRQVEEEIEDREEEEENSDDFVSVNF